MLVRFHTVYVHIYIVSDSRIFLPLDHPRRTTRNQSMPNTQPPVKPVSAAVDTSTGITFMTTTMAQPYGARHDRSLHDTFLHDTTRC